MEGSRVVLNCVFCGDPIGDFVNQCSICGQDKICDNCIIYPDPEDDYYNWNNVDGECSKCANLNIKSKPRRKGNRGWKKEDY